MLANRTFKVVVLDFFQLKNVIECDRMRFFSAEECDRNDPEQSGRPADDHVRVERQGPQPDGLAPVSLPRPGENQVLSFEVQKLDGPLNHRKEIRRSI
jgi:hypothetical protein